MSSPTLLNPAGSWHLQQQQNARQQSVASVSDRCSAIFAGRSVAGCRHSCSLPLPVTPCRGSVSAAGAREHSVIDFTPSERQVPLFSCVEDVMTKTHIHTCRPYTTIDDALETLVEKRITGMPVLDDQDQVVGVVSDFDLLSLDGISGRMRATGMFPDTHTEWSAFFEVQKLLVKNTGKTVADVMTSEPMVVRGNTDLEAAARLLLERRIRRMPVVDSQGRLVGIFSRGDVIRAALVQRKAAVAAGVKTA